jgi:L-threonylcarbamoyladenylate synthase
VITKDINWVIELLNNQNIVSIPTETVYGLAGNAFSDKAIERIFKLKNRPLYNPLIVHLKSIEQLSQVAIDIPAKAMALAQQFWPGPLTLVLKKQSHISDLITAGKNTVAVRVPNHPLTLELLNKLNFPLAAPSANPFGCISPTKAIHVFNYFENELDAILDGGDCDSGIESTIIGFEEEMPILYRLGSISLEEIKNAIGEVDTNNAKDKEIKSPGMLSSHYAPRTTTLLTDDINKTAELHLDKKLGFLLFQQELDSITNVEVEVLSSTGDLREAARNLYSALHRLDNKNLDLIIAEKLPNYGLGRSINDRLIRAST